MSNTHGSNTITPKSNIKSSKNSQDSSKTKKKKSPEFSTEFAKKFGEFKFEVIDSHTHVDDVQNWMNKPEPSVWNWQKLHKELILGNQPHVLTVCCESASWNTVLKMLDDDTSDTLRGAFAIHPNSAHEWNEEISAMTHKAMKHPKVVALGECGLDYHRKAEDDLERLKTLQKKVFIEQIKIALEYKKPQMTHLREADDDAVELLKEYLPKDYPQHVHCCTSPSSFVKRILENFTNGYIGFTGVITYPKTESIQESVRSIPLNRILLETDAPYMAPVPFRYKTCHSGMILYVAEKIAEIHGVSLEEVVQTTRNNVKNLYGI